MTNALRSIHCWDETPSKPGRAWEPELPTSRTFCGTREMEAASRSRSCVESPTLLCQLPPSPSCWQLRLSTALSQVPCWGHLPGPSRHPVCLQRPQKSSSERRNRNQVSLLLGVLPTTASRTGRGVPRAQTCHPVRRTRPARHSTPGPGLAQATHI